MRKRQRTTQTQKHPGSASVTSNGGGQEKPGHQSNQRSRASEGGGTARAAEAAKAAEALDPKYERLLDKLIAQSQGFPKMEILFGEVATALDLLPRKKVEAFKRNMECIARVADKLFSQPQP